MTRQFRWTRPLGDAAVTVERVAGDHDLAAGDRECRYRLSLPGGGSAGDAAVDAPAGCEVEREGAVWLRVGEGTGIARVRLRAGADATVLRVAGPGFDDDLTAALDGDQDAARAVLGAFAGAVPAVFACGTFLDVEGVVALVDALAAASGTAADDLHAARYDLVRVSATTAAGPRLADAEDVEALVGGLDEVAGIGDVDVLDALAAATAVAHDSPGATRRWLADLGFDVAALADRGDGRFLACYLAQVARTRGVPAARQRVARRAAGVDHEDFAAAKAAAERADYWDRGAAWRDALLPAAGESEDVFAYVLANALYWTGEVARTDSRADELCHEGAAAAAATIDLDWVVGRARFERHRAAGHRHRSGRNHALAVAHFDAARALASEYDFLDPWEPTYSRAVVESNRLSAAGEHEAAVAVLDDALDALRDQGVPDGRFAELRDHLVGQRREREATLADGDGERLTHLEAARDRYERLGFDRSVARIEAKLDGGGEGASTGGRSRDDRGPAPVPPSGDVGPRLEDIPDLHDFLTEPDPTAVGSADPGVLPDERSDREGFADDPRRDGEFR
ncbi:hypothetical protein [Halobacterium yunchengense]|uniref:hypothetical protein n=1 Tax=Halobacterium yunchengense TaxID=3108497 RepID=UPI0030090769